MKYDKETALIVVDMQNDFADPHGSLAVNGALDLIPLVNYQIGEASKAGSRIVYTRDWHPPVTPHFAKDGGLWPTHCVADTWGAEYHPDLFQPDENDHEVYKGEGQLDGFSGFEATDLGGYLNRQNVKKVVVIGLAMDYCVKATALSALDLGFDTTIIDRCVLSVNLEPEDGNKAVFEMRQKGVKFV